MKAEPIAHVFQQIDVAAAVFAEREALAEVNLFCVKPVVDYVVEKLLGRLCGKFAIEQNDDRLLDAEHLKICEPLIERLQQRWCRFGMKHSTRMRIEGDRGRDGIYYLGPIDDRLH